MIPEKEISRNGLDRMHILKKGRLSGMRGSAYDDFEIPLELHLNIARGN